MKITLSKSGVFTPEWNNNKKLKKENQIKVLFDYMTVEQKNKIIAGSDGRTFADISKDTYLTCVKKIENLNVDLDGVETKVDYKELLELPALFELFQEITTEMITVSAMTEESKKK